METVDIEKIVDSANIPDYLKLVKDEENRKPKDPTPTEQTAKLLAQLLAVCPVIKTETVVTLESVESFMKRGGVVTVTKPRNAYQSQRPQMIKKAKRTRSFKQFVSGSY